MGICVFVDGELYDKENAVVSVFDRGFLYGDSVYEVMRTSNKVPVDLEPHLMRLRRSADSLMLPLPQKKEIEEAVASTLKGAGNPESYVRVVATRGQGEVGLDTTLAVKPSLIVIAKPLSLPPKEYYQSGASVQIVDVVRTSKHAVDPAVKSGNYLNNILALAEAKKAGAYEALMCNEKGQIAEGSSSNVFIVHNGEIKTPPLHVGLLAGITRMRVMEQAQSLGYSVHETFLSPHDVKIADEVFITSSIRGIMPITRVDGDSVGDGKLGVITKALYAEYGNYLQGH